MSLIWAAKISHQKLACIWITLPSKDYGLGFTPAEMSYIYWITPTAIILFIFLQNTVFPTMGAHFWLSLGCYFSFFGATFYFIVIPIQSTLVQIVMLAINETILYLAAAIIV